MTLRTPRPLAAPVRAGTHGATSAALSPRLRLRATRRGCALIDPDGEVVFYADGIGGRRKCLEYARQHGVLAISR